MRVLENQTLGYLNVYWSKVDDSTTFLVQANPAASKGNHQIY